MPLLPTCGLPSVPVAESLVGLVRVGEASESLGFEVVISCAALVRWITDVGTRCCMIVLFTVNLKGGVPPGVLEDSEIKARRIELMIVVFHDSVLECS